MLGSDGEERAGADISIDVIDNDISPTVAQPIKSVGIAHRPERER